MDLINCHLEASLRRRRKLHAQDCRCQEDSIVPPLQDRAIQQVSALAQLTQRTARYELDSHADTCALGCNLVPLYYTGRACDVIPCNAGAYKPEQDIPIVCGATALTCQLSGETLISIINKGLCFGDKLEHSLLNPTQLQYSGVVVIDNPFDIDVPGNGP